MKVIPMNDGPCIPNQEKWIEYWRDQGQTDFAKAHEALLTASKEDLTVRWMAFAYGILLLSRTADGTPYWITAPVKGERYSSVTFHLADQCLHYVYDQCPSDLNDSLQTLYEWIKDEATSRLSRPVPHDAS